MNIASKILGFLQQMSEWITQLLQAYNKLHS